MSSVKPEHPEDGGGQVDEKGMSQNGLRQPLQEDMSEDDTLQIKMGKTIWWKLDLHILPITTMFCLLSFLVCFLIPLDPLGTKS
jgi:hypothetical protein